MLIEAVSARVSQLFSGESVDRSAVRLKLMPAAALGNCVTRTACCVYLSTCGCDALS